MRSVHLRPSFIALVIMGGALGTAAREAVSLTVAPVGSFPVAIFGINLLGSFALGLLLEGLVRNGEDTGRRQRLRLFAGTGFLGGFTTYSALATETDLLFRAGEMGTGILYAVGTLVLGLIAAWAGIAIAARRHRHSTAAGA